MLFIQYARYKLSSNLDLKLLRVCVVCVCLCACVHLNVLFSVTYVMYMYNT